MAWMFRWLERLLGRSRDSRGAHPGWVEPSNTITRAILAGAVSDLPMQVPERARAIVTQLPARPQPATRTARRTRRRRAGRAA